MSDDGWFILLFILALVLLGLKVVAWVLVILAVLWILDNRP
jgi:hypothetical protein